VSATIAMAYVARRSSRAPLREEYADVDAEDAEAEAVGLTVIPTAVRDEKVLEHGS
jgi:hypothetical protein